MDENILNEYYQKIAEKIEDVIPVKWYEAAFYTEDVGDWSSFKMYFKEEEEGEYLYMMDIPEIYEVDEDEYEGRKNELRKICREFRKEFIKQGVKPWNIFEFYLNSDYAFRVKFGYEYEEEVSSADRAIVWQYKELGIMPKGKFDKKKLNEYVNLETGELKKKM